jgi:uncharacterized membrane protein
MSRRALVIALIVSLAINVFVIGGLAGAVLMGYGRLGPPGPPGPPRLNGMGAALSPEHREAWQAAVRGAVQTAGPQLRQARALRKQAWDAVAADPANPQAAQAALAQSRNLELAARGVMDRAVVDFAATLPAPERAKLAEALSRRGPHPPGGPGGGPPGGGPWSGGGGPGPDRGPPPDR